MRVHAWLLALWAAAGCGGADGPGAPGNFFASGAWEDGRAVVSVYRGRIRRYGKWRQAEIREYAIREFLHPVELTKRDDADPSLLRVIKVNRHVTFDTGTYQYRLMTSLFFDRRTRRLVKGAGSSQEGCGLTFQRWDRNSSRLRYDSYWEGEGAGELEFLKGELELFADEVPFAAGRLPDGAEITVYPSLAGNRLGDREPRRRKVVRTPGVCELTDAQGKVVARFEYDADGLLTRWRIAGEQQFRRAVKRRLYYWEETDPGDERWLR